MRMVFVLVACLALAGALFAASERGWLARLGIPAPRRVLYGAVAGALLGLLLIPVLGLVAAVALFAVGLGALLAVALAVALLARRLARRGP